LFRVARLAWGVVGIFGMAATYNLLFIYTAELFPTAVRNTALGWMSQASQTGDAGGGGFFRRWPSLYTEPRRSRGTDRARLHSGRPSCRRRRRDAPARTRPSPAQSCLLIGNTRGEKRRGKGEEEGREEGIEKKC
jgi:hypothetical protein